MIFFQNEQNTGKSEIKYKGICFRGKKVFSKRKTKRQILVKSQKGLEYNVTLRIIAYKSRIRRFMLYAEVGRLNFLC